MNSVINKLISKLQDEIVSITRDRDMWRDMVFERDKQNQPGPPVRQHSTALAPFWHIDLPGTAARKVRQHSPAFPPFWHTHSPAGKAKKSTVQRKAKKSFGKRRKYSEPNVN